MLPVGRGLLKRGYTKVAVLFDKHVVHVKLLAVVLHIAGKGDIVSCLYFPVADCVSIYVYVYICSAALLLKRIASYKNLEGWGGKRGGRELLLRSFRLT